jgi:hypothetical protein
LSRYYEWKKKSKIQGEEKGKVLFQLEKLCRKFNLPLDESFDPTDEVQVIQRLTAHIEETMKSLNITNIFENQHPILPAGLQLNSQQQVIFETMQEAIYQVQ